TMLGIVKIIKQHDCPSDALEKVVIFLIPAMVLKTHSRPFSSVCPEENCDGTCVFIYSPSSLALNPFAMRNSPYSLGPKITSPFWNCSTLKSSKNTSTRYSLLLL